MRAFFAILCCLVLGIPLVFLTVLTRPQREAILTDIRSQWLRRVEPNMLNRILLSKDSDTSVVLPVSAGGVVLLESDECDLHVAINRDRHISIHGARISHDQLVAIIAYRLDCYRGKPPRVFLWADLSLPSEQVSEWVRLFHEAGCLPVYCVVATGSPVTRRAVLCEPKAAVQTFPITATNTVSGLLETVPVTFRVGGTNGIVERLDGQRFVPVLFRGGAGRGDGRLEIIRRLRAIQLPEIVTQPIGGTQWR